MKMEQIENHARRKKGGLVTMPFIFGKLQTETLVLLYIYIYMVLINLIMLGVLVLMQLMRLLRSWLWWDSIQI